MVVGRSLSWRRAFIALPPRAVQPDDADPTDGGSRQHRLAGTKESPPSSAGVGVPKWHAPSQGSRSRFHRVASRFFGPGHPRAGAWVDPPLRWEAHRLESVEALECARTALNALPAPERAVG